MKRTWQHPEPASDSSVFSRQYWRNFDQLEDTPAFREWVEREFPRGAAELSGEEATEESRRGFLKYMGASLSLAGLGMAGCRRPGQHLVPYNEHVEEQIPGKALYYATAAPGPEGCVPLVATTHEGRPTYLTGNKLHPSGGKSADSFVQASILELYDPDRSKSFLREGEEADAAAFEAEVLSSVRSAKGEQTALLLGASTSPTRERLLERIAEAYPELQVFEYEPLLASGRQEAERELFGEFVSAVPRFDRAEVVLTLDCDFLGLDPVGESPASQWAKTRDPEKPMSRLYTVEPSFTVTGGMADHRLRLPASQMGRFAVLLAQSLGLESEVAPLANRLGLSKEVLPMEWIRGVAEDLLAHQGRALVVAGPRQSKEVHLLVGLINNAVGAMGGPKAPLPLLRHGRSARPGIAELAGAIENGEVKTLFVLTPADPVFDAPADLRFASAVEKLETLVHCGLQVNETGAIATWHVPGAHFLECWGDVISASGVLSIIQPMILPLYGGWSEWEMLLRLLEPEPAEGETRPSVYDAVRETFRERAAGDPEKAWRLALRDGFHEGEGFSRSNSVNLERARAAVAQMKLPDLPHPQGIEVDLNDCPDTLPMLAVLGCFARGRTVLRNVPQARIKETDRIAVMAAELNRMGGRVRELEDGLVIEEAALRGAAVDGHADHRVVMALAVAGTQARGQTRVSTAEAAAVTFPDFAAQMRKLGAQLDGPR